MDIPSRRRRGETRSFRADVNDAHGDILRFSAHFKVKWRRRMSASIVQAELDFSTSYWVEATTLYVNSSIVFLELAKFVDK